MKQAIITVLLATIVAAAPWVPDHARSAVTVERRDGTTEFDPDFALKTRSTSTTKFDPDYVVKA
ncbi:hypothetical protein F5X99DRAFT_405468 [Biscogniauxia marginata]|nr:hypothetical protein F5X99DRAFT_405468 [Biscogniauxia marginata]